MKHLTLLGIMTLGCAAPSAPEPPASEAPTGKTPVASPAQESGRTVWGNEREAPAPRPVEAGPATPAELRPPVNIARRPRRRMNVDQLSDAMRRVSGGIGWTNARGDDLFESLAATLGRPDYIQRTVEELEPTVLFQKFLDDAARDVCTRMLAADMASLQAEAAADPENPPTARILLRHVDADDTIADAPDAVDRNLRHLLAWFHGRDARDADSLAYLKVLVESAAALTDDPTQSWLGVCGVLFTHPDFYTY